MKEYVLSNHMRTIAEYTSGSGPIVGGRGPRGGPVSAGAEKTFQCDGDSLVAERSRWLGRSGQHSSTMHAMALASTKSAAARSAAAPAPRLPHPAPEAATEPRARDAYGAFMMSEGLVRSWVATSLVTCRTPSPRLVVHSKGCLPLRAAARAFPLTHSSVASPWHAALAPCQCRPGQDALRNSRRCLAGRRPVP